MKIAVFCPNLVGDTVMATPTFRALRRRFPDAHLTGIIRPHIAPVLDGNPWFDTILPAHHRSKRSRERTLALVSRLRRDRYDLAVLLPNSLRPALVAWLAGIPRRVGYIRYGRGPLLTDGLSPSRSPDGGFLPVPIVESYLALAGVLGCRGESRRLELGTTREDEAAADRAWQRLGLGRDRPVVCLNTGGAFGPAKNWPAEHFAALARRLVAECGVSILVLCGPSERSSAREIVRLADHARVVSLDGQPLGLGLSKACVRRADLLITTDSGPRHFAAAFQTPVITLFGPTHIAWTRTYHPQALHLIHPVPCGPCQRPTCSEGHHRCMREISPGHVFEAAVRLLTPMKNDRLPTTYRRDLPEVAKPTYSCFAANEDGPSRTSSSQDTAGSQ
jgi:heptosyltransferase-2